MAITLTGNKYTGTITSLGTTNVTDSAASFAAVDFGVNDPRMAWLFRGGEPIALAKIQDRVSTTEFELKSEFFDYDGDTVTQQIGDTYYISLLAGEVATTGWAISDGQLLVTDEVDYGTTGVHDSLFLHIENLAIRTTVTTPNSRAMFEGFGGCVTYGNPLDLKNRVTSDPCTADRVSGSNGNAFMSAKSTAFTQMHFGTKFDQVGNVPGGSGAGNYTPGHWQVFVNCISNQTSMTSPTGGSIWASRPEFQRMINLVSVGSTTNFLGLRWGGGYIEGGSFACSYDGLAPFGGDSSGTFIFGGDVGKRLTVLDAARNGLWRASTNGVVCNIFIANLLVRDQFKNIITGQGTNTPFQTNSNLNLSFKDRYTGLIEDTKVDIRDVNSTAVFTETVGASGITSDIDLVYQVRTHPTNTTVNDVFSNPWDVGMYRYGYNIVSIIINAFDDTLAGRTVKNVEFGGPLVQGIDLNITQIDKLIVDAYTSIDDALQLYDRAAAYLEDNYVGETSTIVSRSASQISLGAVNLNIDASAASVFDFSGGTITIESSTFTGGAIGTTGFVSILNGALLNGGTFGVDINIDNASDGDTYTDITASKIVHTGTGAQTLTLDGGSVAEIEVTGGANLTVTLLNGSTVPTLTQTNGTITLVNNMVINIAGDLLAGDVIRVQDQTGTQQLFDTATSSTYQGIVPRSADGETWRMSIDRAGFSPYITNIPVAEGTTLNLEASMSEYERGAGQVMYTGTTSPNITVSFDLVTPQATIDIGDAQVSLQTVFDEVEDALLTSDGMAWHAQQGTICRYDNLPGSGEIFFMQNNWRVRRENASDVNAAVGGFLISSQSIPVDGSNGSVGFIGGITLDQIAPEVWNALTASYTDSGSTGEALRRLIALVENVGGDRFTAKALEEAPSGGGSGLTQQEVRDAMKLAPSAGAGAADSVDDKLDGIDTQVSGLNDFDPANDTVANVSVVQTTVANSDMRGTDSVPTNPLLTNDARLNNLDAAVSSRSTLDANGVWSHATRSLTTFGTLISDIWAFAVRTVTGGNIDTNADMRGTDGANIVTPDNTSISAIKTKTDQLNFTGSDVQSVASNMRGTDGANTVAPDNAGISSIDSRLPANPAAVSDIPTVVENREEMDNNSTRLSNIDQNAQDAADFSA